MTDTQAHPGFPRGVNLINLAVGEILGKDHVWSESYAGFPKTVQDMVGEQSSYILTVQADALDAMQLHFEGVAAMREHLHMYTIATMALGVILADVISPPPAGDVGFVTVRGQIS